MCPIKVDNEKIVEIIEKLKPKIKKELSQTIYSQQEDLEQEIHLFIVKFLKDYELETLDFFDLMEKEDVEQLRKSL